MFRGPVKFIGGKVEWDKKKERKEKEDRVNWAEKRKSCSAERH